MSVYDYKPMAGASQYLRLTEKGETAKVRIASEPYRSLRIWKESERKYMDGDKVAGLAEAQIDAIMRDPDFTISEVFSWKVVDRFDGQAKVLTMPGSVFKKLAALAANEDWGDPVDYDITVERTENPGSGYWTITPTPNKTPLDEKQLDQIEALDIPKLVTGAKSLEEVEPKPKTDDVAPEKIDDKPIDLSEVPF